LVALLPEERKVRVSPLLLSVAALLIVTGSIQSRSADIDSDACFCLKNVSGRFQRGCRAVKFPNQVYTIAQCRDPERGNLSAPTPITESWTVVMEGEEGCEICWPESPGDGGFDRTPGGDERVVASRLFAEPKQYPPEDFAAYGILAFRSRASTHDRDRHLLICEAYVASLPHESELNVDIADQMVTVWPVDSGASAAALNRMPREGICDKAIDSYGLALALQAIGDAELAGMDLSGIGPFLLAWSPAADKGKRDALVLVADLSDVTTYRQVQELLQGWSREIEQDPLLWRRGWDLEAVRLEIRLWADRYGSRILALFGATE
jgi:hypothetical protein